MDQCENEKKLKALKNFEKTLEMKGRNQNIEKSQKQLGRKGSLDEEELG